jgi:hypothetical protein
MKVGFRPRRFKCSGAVQCRGALLPCQRTNYRRSSWETNRTISRALVRNLKPTSADREPGITATCMDRRRGRVTNPGSPRMPPREALQTVSLSATMSRARTSRRRARTSRSRRDATSAVPADRPRNVSHNDGAREGPGGPSRPRVNLFVRLLQKDYYCGSGTSRGCALVDRICSNQENCRWQRCA